MRSLAMVIEIDIDGRPFMVRSVGPDVLKSSHMAVAELTESRDKPFAGAVGFFFGNTDLSLELWTVISVISGFDD